MKQKLITILEDLSILQDKINDIIIEEETAYENIPDSLKESERAMISEEAIDILYVVEDLFDAVKNNINELINEEKQ